MLQQLECNFEDIDVLHWKPCMGTVLPKKH